MVMRRFLLAGFLSAASALPGCSHETAEGDALWVPLSKPRFVTFGRSTTYALIRDEDHDLLVIEDPIVSSSGEEVVGRLTWLVSLPSSAPMEKSIEVGAETTPAWLVEQLKDEQSHAAPVYGRVTVHHRDAAALSATLNIQCPGEAPTAGVVQRPTTDLDRMITFARLEPNTPQYREMNSRSGVRSRRR